MAPELDIAPSRFDQMEAYEATRIVYSRVQAVDPENASKIMGYLLLQEQGEHQIFCLAMGPDALLQSAIANARLHLGLIKSGALNLSDIGTNSSTSTSSSGGKRECKEHLYVCNQMLQHANLKLAGLQLNNTQQPDPVLQRPVPWSFQQQPNSSCSAAPCSSFSGGVFPNDHFYPETFAFLNSSKMKAEKSGGGWQQLLLHDEISSEIGSSSSCWKPCVYYSRGFCRHGSSCRFLHNNFSPSSPNSGHSSPDSNSLADHSDESGGGANGGSELGSLERLEIELQELLASRKAPVSIAALPQLYYERFGRPLQAEGYLTESQRHGKSGYNLTRLLSKLRESITLIDRPHGQHAVVLAEDAHKYATSPGEHYDLNGVNPSSRQIYLTFPAESAFSEDDVNIHFRAYGPVQDVRIPYQQKRMFGFVTFVYPETVKIVLSEGNPHYICGARVLVKPYRERGKHGDRKHLEKSDSAKYTEVSARESNIPVLKLLDENSHDSHLLEEQGKWSLGFNSVHSQTSCPQDQHQVHGNGNFGLLLNALEPGINTTFKPSNGNDRVMFSVADQQLRSWSNVAKSASCQPEREEKQELYEKTNTSTAS